MNNYKISSINGYPELFINGKHTPPLIYTLTYFYENDDWHTWADKNIKAFHDAGIDIVSVCTYMNWDWKEKETFKAEKLLKVLYNVVNANKNAKILIRYDLTPPKWWMEQNPDELILYKDKYDHPVAYNPDDYSGFQNGGDKGDTSKAMRASYVSKKWQDDVCTNLVTLSDILKKSNIVDNIFAIQVAYGTCGEWHMWGNPFGDDTSIADYSPCMLEFFRNYLKNKYKTDQALSLAWNVQTTFETAQLATPSMRLAFEENNRYLLPEHSMQALDTWKCFQLGAPTAIAKFAKCLKDEWGEHLLVGSFYNYYFGCGNVYSRFLEPSILINDKNVDFFCAPNGYTANKFSGNTPFLRYMAESMRLNNKLFICETDQGYKSYYHYRSQGDTYICENNTEFNSITTRNIMDNILRGMGSWYFDHRHPKDRNPRIKKGYWVHPDCMQNIKNIQDFCSQIPSLRPKFIPTPDVLLVYDTQTIYYMGIAEDIHNSYNQFDTFNAIAKSGVGYDVVNLEDIYKTNLDQYKCVLFVSCEVMPSNTVKFIKNNVMSNNRTVAFMGRNAYIVDNHTDLDNIYRLYGTKNINTFSNIKNDNCTTVIIPTQSHESSFYRELFTKANAHIYTDNNELLCVQNGFISIHCKETPTTHLHLPCGDFEIQNEKYSTKVFDILTGKQVL